MKFIVQPTELKAACLALKSVASAHNPMPVLDNILFQPSVGEQTFLLTCGDIDSSCTVALPVEELCEPRPFLIPFVTLSSYIDKVGDWPIEVEVSSTDEIVLTDLLGDFHCLCGADVSEYPMMPDIKEPTSVSVPAAAFCKVVSAAVGYCGNDEFRKVMNGVAIDFREDGLRIVASDAKILFFDLIPEGAVSKEDETVIILPPKLGKRLSSIFQCKADDVIEVQVNKGRSRAIFRQGATVLRTPLIEGNYPRYDIIIPKSPTIFISIQRAQLSLALERVAMAAPSSTGLVSLDFDGHSSLSAQADDMDYSLRASAKVPTVSQSGSAVRIGIRSAFLRQAVQTIGEDVITFSLVDPQRAFLVSGSDPAAAHRKVLLVPFFTNSK